MCVGETLHVSTVRRFCPEWCGVISDDCQRATVVWSFLWIFDKYHFEEV